MTGSGRKYHYRPLSICCSCKRRRPSRVCCFLCLCFVSCFVCDSCTYILVLHNYYSIPSRTRSKMKKPKRKLKKYLCLIPVQLTTMRTYEEKYFYFILFYPYFILIYLREIGILFFFSVEVVLLNHLFTVGRKKGAFNTLRKTSQTIHFAE